VTSSLRVALFMSKVPSLLELCIDTLASHIELCSELQGVPEEIVLDVFEVLKLVY